MKIKIDNVKCENLKGDLVNIKTGKDKNVKITVDGKTYVKKKLSLWSRIVNFLKGR